MFNNKLCFVLITTREPNHSYIRENAKIWSLDEIPIPPLYNHQHEQQEEGEDQEDIIDDEEQERRLSARYRRLFMLPLRKEVRVGSQASSSSSSSTSRRHATASSLHLNDK